jgi:predicted O-methyltransferase YrrM
MSDVQVRINPRNLSLILWEQWIGNIEEELPKARTELAAMFDACEATRSSMSYNTGSITFAAAILLYVATRNIRPSQIFEVGTFIGKSTLAMGLAVDRNGADGKIFTCDGSNDFKLPRLTKCAITGFSKTVSTSALQQVAAGGARIDFFHIDGRISAEDLEIIEHISDPRVVIALDDFEGIEKGVANLSLIKARPYFGQHVLVYPAADHVLARLGVSSGSTSALLFPLAALKFTNQ